MSLTFKDFRVGPPIDTSQKIKVGDYIFYDPLSDDLRFSRSWASEENVLLVMGIREGVIHIECIYGYIRYSAENSKTYTIKHTDGILNQSVCFFLKLKSTIKPKPKTRLKFLK